MYLIFLDTETTGLNPEKHRIIEIAYRVYETQSEKTILSYETILSQPLEIWASADPKSLQINGFIWEDLLKGKTEKSVSAEITNDFNHLDLGNREGIFVCQNPSFDRVFFLQLIPADIQDSLGWPYHWLDLASMYWALRLKQDRTVMKYFKECDLSKNEIAKYLGIAAENQPHRAMNGVKHLISCYEALFGKFSPSTDCLRGTPSISGA